MTLRRIKCRVALLTLMLAVAMLSITLAVTRPSTEIWPTYLAVTWIVVPAAAHDSATHASLAQEFFSPAVIREALTDPKVSGIAPMLATTDPGSHRLDDVRIEVHPDGQGYRNPKTELIRVVVESASASEGVLVRDALVGAYLSHHNTGPIRSVAPAVPERTPHPIFDRPWKVRVAVTFGVFLSIISLMIPIRRSQRFWRMVAALSIIGLVLVPPLWWILSHPEFYVRIGRFRIL